MKIRFLPRPLSLRQRLFLALALPLTLILSTSSLVDYRLARETSDLAHDQSLADDVFDIESHLRAQGFPATYDLSQEAESMQRSNAPDKVYFSVRDEHGVNLSGDAGLSVFPTGAGSKVDFFDATYLGARVRVAGHRVDFPTKTLFITVVETTEKREASRQKLLTAMLLPNLAVIFVCLLAVVFGVRQGLLPLDAIERQIGERSPDDLRQISVDDVPREMRPTVLRLNQLFSLLQVASEAQKRFIADAAHQLRTPLAALQAQVDLAVAEGTFARNAVRLQLIEEATGRISRLLGQLLAYARAESSSALLERREVVDLTSIVEESASLFLDAALTRELDLGFDISPAATYGVGWLLREALGNLVDNAIRYSGRGGEITVRCGTENGRPFLEVEDNGPGIPLEFQQQVFERFVRLPGSGGDGCGLGLPIVREIVERHGGEVHLSEPEGGGLRVRLAFPAVATLVQS